MVRVSAGVIVRDGAVLLCRRRNRDGSPGLWEFPGGKQEAGETAQECLARECMEELALPVKPGKALATFVFSGEQPIGFTFLLAEASRAEAVCHVHAEIRWVSPDTIAAFPLCPADAAALPKILRHLKREG